VNLKLTVDFEVSSLAESLGAIAARPTTEVQPLIQDLATISESNLISAPSTVAQPAPAFASLPATMNLDAPLAAGTAASLDDNNVDNFFARAQIPRRHTPVVSRDSEPPHRRTGCAIGQGFALSANWADYLA